MVSIPETLPVSVPELFGGRTIQSVNIKDVAKEAGVAVSTVSRVINNHTDVKDKTKEHVLNIIKKLNYIPNNSARNLKRITTNSIGIFVLGKYNPFFGKITESLESEISKNGYSTIVHFHQDENSAMEAAVQFVLEKKLVGLLHLGGFVTKENEGFLEGLNSPVVYISAIFEIGINRKLFSSVSINEVQAVNDVMDYLIASGHRKIGMIIPEKEGLCTSPERFEAYVDFLNNQQIGFDNEYIESGDYSIESGYNSMKKLLNKNSGITAVFAVNDLMAIGAIKAVFDSGLVVPDDISIVGFDGLDYGKFYNPSLTTIKQPDIEFGKISCSLLFDLIKNSEEMKHIVLDTEFLERDSSRTLK